MENLSLAENAIESFVSASFQHLPKLKSLDLANNRVNKLVVRDLCSLCNLHYAIHFFTKMFFFRNVSSTIYTC